MEFLKFLLRSIIPVIINKLRSHIMKKKSELDKEYKALVDDSRRILAKIEKIVDVEAEKKGISFNNDSDNKLRDKK